MTRTAPETLAHRIRRVRDESGSVDPRELAEKVLADLDGDGYYRDALAATLPEFIRVTLGRERMQLANSAPEPGRHTKFTVVRSWWQRELATGLDVSTDGSGRWKQLAECTRGDLLAVASNRRVIAAKNVAQAERYERLAALLPDDTTKAAVIREDAAAAIFGRAA